MGISCICETLNKPETFGIVAASKDFPHAIDAMKLKWLWIYFFKFKNGNLGVKLDQHDAPLMWDGECWVTGRQQWFEDFEM